MSLKVSRRLHRLANPIRAAQLDGALATLTGGGTEILMVHSSLSACGGFTAGPEGVLSGLRKHCGTLVLPTQSYCYPVNPGEPGPLFQAATTPSQNGLLTEVFRSQPGVLRSIHATHALAVEGPMATEVCEGHYLNDSPCGPGTPYSRLIQRRVSALMFGVNFLYYTFFHTAEFESGSDAAFEHGTRDWLRVIDEQGVERDCFSRRQSRSPMRFAEAGELLEHKGLVSRAQLGRGVLWYVPDCSKVHDFLLERLRRTPDFLRHSCRSPLQ